MTTPDAVPGEGPDDPISTDVPGERPSSVDDPTPPVAPEPPEVDGSIEPL